MIDSPRAREKNRTKVLFKGNTTRLFNLQKNTTHMFRFAPLYCGMLPTGRTSLMLSTISRFLLHQLYIY